MEILLTGYTAFLTQEWIETAFPDDHVLTTHTKSEALPVSYTHLTLPTKRIV